MTFGELIAAVGEEPVFGTGLLRVGAVAEDDLRLQLVRWTKAGKLLQLRRGLYMLGEPYRKAEPHAFMIANALRHGSYVSLQSALAYHGMIPEAVAVVTSVTTGRTGQVVNAMGSFLFRHVKASCFFGYESVQLGAGQSAFVAAPEKALLDLVYLTPGGAQIEYLRELRLQNMETLRPDVLGECATRMGKPKIHRAIENLCALAHQEEYEDL